MGRTPHPLGLHNGVPTSHALELDCKPTCGRDQWDGLPLRRDLGVAFVSIAGVAALTEVILLGVRHRRRGEAREAVIADPAPPGV